MSVQRLRKLRRNRSATPAPTPAPQPSPQRHVWPVFKVFAGGALGYFWLWGNTVQLGTSEAWFLHQNGVSLAPHFSIILQITDFWTGFNPQYTIAYTWAWGIQVLMLVFSIGIEWPVDTQAGRTRARWFKYGTIVCVVLNSLADFFFSNTFGFWEQLAFVGITLMMSCYFGLLGLHLILSGLKAIFSTHSLRG